MKSNNSDSEEFSNEIFNAVGVNPGRVKINRIRWMAMHPWAIIIQVVGMVLGLILTIKIHWIFVLVLIGFVFYTILHWWNAKIRFDVGQVSPGKVVQLNPDRIAVATDLSYGDGDYPVLKILNIKLRKEDKVLNKIIPTIAVYSYNPYGHPFWAEVNPVPMNFGLADKNLIDHYSSTYGVEEIDTLNEYLDQVKTLEPETYKINEDTSDWVNFKNVIVGDLKKMKGSKKFDGNA